jgi:hypothetical protein
LEGVCRQLALLYAARERPEAQVGVEDAALVGGECERGSVFKLVDLARLYRVFERC